VTARHLIAWAYAERFPIAGRQIVGGPDWIFKDRFDIDARAAGDSPRTEMLGMLRQLLADRFKLVAREEQREMRVYALRLAGGKPGPGLKPSAGDDCLPAGATAPPGARLRPCGAAGFVTERGFARAATMDAIARQLLPAVGGDIVVNKTGLAGTFSFDLEYAPPRLSPVPGAAASNNPSRSDLPSLFTVLEEQLGLRLQPEQAAADVLVVERLEPPSAN
jgi:uncharacterized protein (TIGR03435 family)